MGGDGGYIRYHPDALKAYGSTIEEARADLFGLYYVADPKLVELDVYKRQGYHLHVHRCG